MYKVFKPKSEILRKYISEFTILKKDHFSPIKYFALPHDKAVISFFNQTKLSYNDFILELDRERKNSPLIIGCGKYTTPLFLDYKNFIDEVAINFTPTGINYFFDEDFEKIAPAPVQFINNNNWIEFSNKMFEKDKDQRIDYLERFLLSELRNKKIFRIENIVNKLQSDKTLKIKDIAIKMNISERTINRLSHKYLGCSPKDFKKIVRFRSALSMKTKEISLTELCLNNEYYDSPHFTNEFKILTNRSPRDFFKSMIEVSDEKFPYIFL